MSLSDRVHIARRFQLSIRIDSDLRDPKALEGFVCPKSSATVLQFMSQHVSTTGQAAFTWTGPYGTGKSSLALALSAFLNGDNGLRKIAAQSFDTETSAALKKAFPSKKSGWKILPVVGQRMPPSQVIGEALVAHGLVSRSKTKTWSDSQVLSEINALISSDNQDHGGVLVFVDEMGKFLEGAARDSGDIFLFQQLAEAANRSQGRLLLVGVLHQAFDEYARNLARESRDEWAKVQGRFLDLAINATGDEQIELISRAIHSDNPHGFDEKMLSVTVETVREGRPSATADLSDMLSRCWPLHPVVTCLLGPISRRRFGQNQRSLFGFLNSAEPYGFQDFLRDAREADLFYPERLWDYLRANLEPSILASPDGHRWSMAVEVVERCLAVGASPLHLQLVKTIALLHLFAERSGLKATPELLRVCIAGVKSPTEVKKALEDLRKWSFILFCKHQGAYSVYAGSDFDLESALNEEMESIKEVDFEALRQFAALQPVLAKRHYHATGALRWFDMDLVKADDLLTLKKHHLTPGSIGRVLLVIPTLQEKKNTIIDFSKRALKAALDDLILGISPGSWQVVELARELLALKKIMEERPELGGDSVARREVLARIADVRARLELDLRRMLDTAEWFRKEKPPVRLSSASLNLMVSTLADAQYHQSPRMANELLNREHPSTNAIAAQKSLLRLMTLHEGKPRLGIDGFPAEGGLYDSILHKSKLHRMTSAGWVFALPTPDDDPCHLAPSMGAATSFLEENAHRPVAMSELYHIWEDKPFGVKKGLLPVFGVALLLALRDRLAFYREGIFQSRFTDLEVDYLTQDPASIQIRWMELSDESREILSGLANVVRTLDAQNELKNLAPIDVARALVAQYEGLHQWVKRTTHLSDAAKRVRELFKVASDPNKFLFDDIPSLSRGQPHDEEKPDTGRIVAMVREGLEELTLAYPRMLERIKTLMLSELQVPNDSTQALADLRARAENIHGLSGDFQLEAFIGRLKMFSGTQADLEGIASLLMNKPPRDWVDADLDRATLAVADLSTRFIRTEAYARVKGRKDKRQAMAVVVGVEGRPTPVAGEFAVQDTDRGAIDSVIHQVEAVLATSDASARNIILAALAEVSARYLQAKEPKVSYTPSQPGRRKT